MTKQESDWRALWEIATDTITKLQAERDRYRNEAEAYEVHCRQSETDRDRLREEVERTKAERDRLVAEVAQLNDIGETRSGIIDESLDLCDQLQADRDRLAAEVLRLTATARTAVDVGDERSVQLLRAELARLKQPQPATAGSTPTFGDDAIATVEPDDDGDETEPGSEK